MIVVDTSALMAIIFREPEAEACAAALDDADSVAISAGTLSEAIVVASGHDAVEVLENLLDSFPLEVFPVDEAEARRVGAVYRRWGRASRVNILNWGDCFAYSLANRHACPLLFIGKDFGKTDIQSALNVPT